MAAASRRIVSSCTTPARRRSRPRFEVTGPPLDRLGERVATGAGEVGVSAGVQHEGAAGRAARRPRALDGLIDAEQPALPGVLQVAARRPSSTARATVRPTSPAVSPYPASRSAVTGKPTAARLQRRARASCRGPVLLRPGLRRTTRARAGRGDGREANLLKDPADPASRRWEHEAGACVQGRRAAALSSKPGCHEPPRRRGVRLATAEPGVPGSPVGEGLGRAGRVRVCIRDAALDTKSSSGSRVSTPHNGDRGLSRNPTDRHAAESAFYQLPVGMRATVPAVRSDPDERCLDRRVWRRVGHLLHVEVDPERFEVMVSEAPTVIPASGRTHEQRGRHVEHDSGRPASWGSTRECR